MLKIKKKLSGLLAMAMAITTCMNYAPPIFAQEGEAAKTIIHCTFEKDGDTGKHQHKQVKLVTFSDI